MQWELKCQKITEAGILCGERPWNLYDQKCVSLLYLSIGTEGRRLLTQKIPHDNIYDLTTLKLWEMMEIAFVRPRNITFDRYVYFSRKQMKGETVEQFYSILKELAENCDFENREEAIIRDIFITNMLDDDIQRDLLRDTVEPERALSIAVNMEMGNQNQQRISSNNGATGSTVNAIQQFNRFCGADVRGNQSSRAVTNRASVGQCRGCGQIWTPTHRQVCPAMGKKCNHYGLQNHFAKVCRQRLNNTRNTQQTNRINTVETAETSNQNSSQENQNVNYINYNELELLGVVWSVEHFKFYLYGKPFTVITDHRALLSIMRENRSNKSYNSRLTRWVDRLPPFDFSIDHLPGTKMGLVDYISRDPHQQAVNISAYDEQFIVAKLDVIKRSAKRFLLNAENYVDFAARNPPTKSVINNPNSSNNLCSEFAP